MDDNSIPDEGGRVWKRAQKQKHLRLPKIIGLQKDRFKRFTQPAFDPSI